MLVRIVGASSELVRVRLSDSLAQPLTATPDIEETWPYWSEPAQRLAYQASSDGVSHDLWLWDPEQGATTAIARSPQRDEQWPVWSPLRPQLAFAFRGGDPPAGLGLADVASRTPQLLVATGPRDFFLRPSFAPDGAALVAQRRSSQGRGSGLWTIDLNGAAKPLTRDPAWFDMKPSYSRDGSEIFFSRRPAAGGRSDILAISARGGAPRTLVGGAESDDHSARPSPRRDEIVFVSDRDGGSALYLATLSGDALRPLGSDPARNYYAPHWSPDGERVAAIAVPDHVGQPKLAERDALAATHVVVFDREGRTLFDAPGFMPDWMPPWRAH